MLILGINAYHADASAALLCDGRLIAAAEEERFVRIKHVSGFPSKAIRYCLKAGGVRPEDLGAIAISRNPRAHLLPRAWAAFRRGLNRQALQDRLANLVSVQNVKKALAYALEVPPKRLKAKTYFAEHHRAHTASSFYPSGWEEAVVLSLDGLGDFMSGAWGMGRGNRLFIHGGVSFPHSLGILYTAITQFLGFSFYGDEYKVMGLAAYGRPERYRQAMATLVQEGKRRGYRLGLQYFRHQAAGALMTWASGAPSLEPLFAPSLEKLLGPARQPQDALEERHADIAAALQERLEQVVFRLMQALAVRYRSSRLCYAGGVALNCTLNGKITQQTPFRHLFIQPAAYDGGTSLGAALYVAHHLQGRPRALVMTHAAWGPDVDEERCRQALDQQGVPFRRLNEASLCEAAAAALSKGKIVGWFQGRMEFGPRALGHRSLLADPRDPKMKERINACVKRRESFRPFAPSILTEALPAYFPGARPDPFMLFTAPADDGLKTRIPAVVHADSTGRLQAVDPEVDPLFWKLLKTFETRTGVPVLLNTSFNEQEPIVCHPKEALACFQRNGVDCLALGPFWVEQKRGAA